jgi:hypothetical protein
MEVLITVQYMSIVIVIAIISRDRKEWFWLFRAGFILTETGEKFYKQGKSEEQ